MYCVFCVLQGLFKFRCLCVIVCAGDCVCVCVCVCACVWLYAVGWAGMLSKSQEIKCLLSLPIDAIHSPYTHFQFEAVLNTPCKRKYLFNTRCFPERQVGVNVKFLVWKHFFRSLSWNFWNNFWNFCSVFNMSVASVEKYSKKVSKMS